MSIFDLIDFSLPIEGKTNKEMSAIRLLSESEKDTIQLAGRIACQLKAGDVLCLFGELGSGKTIFTKGIAKGLNISIDKVRSPTFVLMNQYSGRLALYHFDLYRLDDLQEVCLLGYEEFFFGDGVTVVEWAEKLNSLMPKDFLEVKIQHKGETKRLLEIIGHGSRFQEIIRHLK